MRRVPKPAKAKVEAKFPVVRKSPKNEGSRVRDLEKRLAESLEREKATAEILRVISSSPTDVQPVFETILDRAVALCGARHGSLFRFDGRLLHAAAHHDVPPATQEVIARRFPSPPDWGTASGRAILTRQVATVEDILADERYEASAARAGGFRSLLGVPLLRDGSPIGVITIVRSEPGPFSEKQIALLQTFADQAVIAIENVRLFTELQEKNRALTEAHGRVSEALEQQTATSEILRVISSAHTDAQPVFDTIVQSAVRLCDGLYSALHPFDGELIHLVAQHNFTPEALEAAHRIFPARPTRALLPGRAILERAVVQIPDVEIDPEHQSDQELTRAVGWRSGLFVPMLREGAPIGVIVVARAEPGPFSDNEIELLKTFADQAVIAIENVRLFTELQARNRDLSEALDRQTATADILRVISQAQTDVQPVFEVIADSAMRLLRAWAAAVFRYDGELVSLTAARGGLPGSTDAARELLQSPHPPTFPHEQPVLTKRVHHVVDVETDPSCNSEFRRHAAERGVRSFVAVPMLRGSDPLGIIGVSRAQPGGFSTAEIALLQTFADQAVIAVENARLLAELQARTHELTRSVGQLTALGEVGRAVSSTLDLQAVLATIVGRATELAGGDAGVIYEYDEEREIFEPRATERLEEHIIRSATPIRKGQGTTGKLADVREPIQRPDIRDVAEPLQAREVLIRAGYRAVLAVPLVREDRLLGGLTVLRKTPGAFASEVVDLLRTFATQSALAIQNARLFREIADKSHQLEVASQHKSEFLANMSHELRTPLNAIIGFSEVLAEGMFGEVNEKQTEYLRDILESGQHLLSLINDILDLSKIEAGRMELELTDFDLPQAISNALTLVRERAGRRGIALHQAVDQRLGPIRGDERKIKQVLLNLLSNALKFTPEGGRVDVRAGVVDGLAEISVTDTGVGIAPEDQEAVFEEFRQVGTAAKKVEGTGLGLALSRKFIELHGGRIRVKSQMGMGSTFSFTLPPTIDRQG